MTINIGPITATAMHYTTDNEPTFMPRTLCQRGGASLALGTLHGFTSTADKVTCQNCIEWLHA